MDLLDHDKLNTLVQYCTCFTHQLEILRKKTPNINKNELCRCAEGMVRVTRQLIDDKCLGGVKVSEPKVSKDTTFWALIVLCVLLFFVGVFQGMQFIAIQNLESAVFHNDYSYKPKAK